MSQQASVTIPVLIACIFLTALTTAGIFMTVTCLTIRSRRKNDDWEAQKESFQKLHPGHSMPHVIDLQKSYAGPASRYNAASDSTTSSVSSLVSEQGKRDTLVSVREKGENTTPEKEVLGNNTSEKGQFQEQKAKS
jgi:hypothetical protein